jgi:pyruvate dehydrogenase E2 component (dihydrolipoamide acetyltransferase)
VPVLRGVQDMTLADVTRASRDLVERAREGKLLPDDLDGGTFTLSNMGMFDVDASTPIINLPECAILGLGSIAPRPAVINGELCVRQMVTLSLTYDHRAIDGAPAARFLERTKQLVEQPYLALVQ